MGYTSTFGVFDPATGILTLGSLAAGETVTFTLTANILTFGLKFNQLEVIATDQGDVNSIPNNQSVFEDDLSQVLVNLPRLLGKRLLSAR